MDPPAPSHYISPACEMHQNSLSWCDSILGHGLLYTSKGHLFKLECCKAQSSPFHKFLGAYFRFSLNGTTFKIAAIFDWCPAQAFDQALESTNTSSSSLLFSHSVHTPHSSSSSITKLSANLGKDGFPVVAHDCKFMPKKSSVGWAHSLTLPWIQCPEYHHNWEVAYIYVSAGVCMPYWSRPQYGSHLGFTRTCEPPSLQGGEREQRLLLKDSDLGIPRLQLFRFYSSSVPTII